MRASILLLLVGCLPSIGGCGAAGENGTRSESAKGALHLELVSAYKPLRDCMEPLLRADHDSVASLKDRAFAFSQQGANFSWFESQASLIVDLDTLPAGTDRRTYAENILMALAKFGDRDDDKSMGARVLRVKAVALSMIYLSGGSEGKCQATTQLFQWL